ncbi:LPXTG cell wall anchor domain-containing protein [Arthrobacter sp. KBS0703]|uniref:LPXTG cell wall anchor domain-containing protein n=1 Tax=Arthrobacter sp. KBS0703 TaxID=1955698 RepID=UPI00098F40D7|nr:LPXTG cell wall anchor domain-containing protein [Arthrobacter sp. KBS0703]TSE14707.1 LPXTG cell wall anchor domain-containing protein [Arthrobacter sp. KBS0703]
MKKSIAALALAGTIALTGAVPAMATTNNYVPGTGTGTVTDGTVTPGQVFTFSGTGFLAGETITITVTITSTPQALGGGFSGGASMAVPSKINVLAAPQTFTTTAAADGSFAFPLSLSEPGTYTLTAVGNTSGHKVTQSVTVVAAAGTGTGLSNTGANGAGLANTGADSSLILWSLIGGGALVAGAASVVVVRRRANADASA